MAVSKVKEVQEYLEHGNFDIFLTISHVFLSHTLPLTRCVICGTYSTRCPCLLGAFWVLIGACNPIF